jgi:hypothetical protein
MKMLRKYRGELVIVGVMLLFEAVILWMLLR